MGNPRKALLVLLVCLVLSSVITFGACQNCNDTNNNNNNGNTYSNGTLANGSTNNNGTVINININNNGTNGNNSNNTCPINIVSLGICSPLLSGIVSGSSSTSNSSTCCALLGLLGINLEICLCLAVDINVLGLITVDIPKLDIVVNVATTCGYSLPSNFTCPNN